VVATGWPRGTGAGSMGEPALSVYLPSVWRLCGTGGTWQTKRHPPKPLSCKALRHVWRVRHLFFTFWGRTKSRKKILRTAHRYFLVEDRALTTRHTCHTCLKPVWRKGFRVRRLGGTCSTQAPPCTQSASLPVPPALKPVKIQKKWGPRVSRPPENQH
jgi:hypothetical protein